MTGTCLVVTGTGTGVGKTIVTAAIAALARDRGESVAVVKPAQSGVERDEVGDLDTISRLSAVGDIHELVRYPDALAPAAAARLSGIAPPSRASVADYIADLATEHDLVLIEGAGGLLVEFDDDGTTIADIAHDTGAQVVVVADPELGTLNHTALTIEALRRRGFEAKGVVLGRWPAEPDLACRSNLGDLAVQLGAPISGAIEDDAAQLQTDEFLAAARAGLAPHLGGHFDGADFTQRFNPRRNV